jgi:acetate---CoA ligase (ADP-forming)
MGIAGAVVLANGFAERGDAGTQYDSELRQAIRRTGVRVIGPNTSGMLNVPLNADLVGLPETPSAGPVSVVTQSGNMLLSMLAEIDQDTGTGFDVYVGLGNEIDVSYAECVAVLARRELYVSELRPDAADLETVFLELTEDAEEPQP